MASENQEAPNRVADAAELLAQFCETTDLIVDNAAWRGEWLGADNRAAIIAAQLLAVASATERIAIALESLMAVCAARGDKAVTL